MGKDSLEEAHRASGLPPPAGKQRSPGGLEFWRILFLRTPCNSWGVGIHCDPAICWTPLSQHMPLAQVTLLSQVTPLPQHMPRAQVTLLSCVEQVPNGTRLPMRDRSKGIAYRAALDYAGSSFSTALVGRQATMGPRCGWRHHEVQFTSEHQFPSHSEAGANIAYLYTYSSSSSCLKGDSR